MIFIYNLIKEIIKNNKTKRIVLIFLLISPLFYINLYFKKFNLEPTSLFPISLLIIIGVIYIFVLLFKLFFELTSTEANKEDVKPMYLFWTLFEFQIIFTILLIPFLFIFLNYYTQIPELVSNMIILIFISIYHLILVCIIGSRSRDNIFSKIKIFFENKELFINFSFLTIINLIFQFGLVGYFKDYLQLLITFILFSIFYLIYITLIREWQKIYFKNEISVIKE